MKFGSLQVHTPDGGSREFSIDLPSLVVGRAEGNGIVIDDLSISRRHARLIIESGRLMVEDLGSAAGTFVDGHRVEPGTSNLVENDQPIRFGDVSAQFVPAPPGSASEGESASGAAVNGAGLAVPEELPSTAIRVTVTSPAMPVEPGGAVFATAVIQNRGRVVDLVTLGVSGVPPAWVTFSQNTLALVPGSRETVTLVFQPPVNPESLAGEYDFGVVVNSGEHEREIVDFGKLVVQPFEATELHLSPLRSKRDFIVAARNNGNALVTYGLSGVDEEGAMLFDFDAPSIELQPGTERRVPLRVRRRKRQLFGRPQYAPMRIVATPTTGAAVAVETPGQLLVQPPLERWKYPSAMAFIVAMLALAAWLSYLYRTEIPTWIPWSTKHDQTAVATGNPEAAYAGVHMCDKSEAERAKAQSKSAPAGGTTGAPLFAQNNPAWAKKEYAKAGDPEFGPDWCGTTIEQCGCAMTSVATIMALFQIVAMPDGSELTPESVNAWFNGEARKTSRGWVSRGYIYGDVIWTAANELSGQIAKTRPNSPTLRFAGFGVGSDEEIRSELQAGRPMVLEVPGHYIAAVGLDGDKILINDPYYPDRRTLDAYKGKVKGSVKFEPSNDLSGVVITVPKDLRVRVLDKQGKVVGSLNTDETTSPAPVGITGAYISSRNAWRDPTCVESPPPADAGTTSIFLPGTAEDYRIEVLNPGSGGTTVAIHSYDQAGNLTVETRDSTGPSVIGMSYDPTKQGVALQVIQGSTPAPDGATTASPGGGSFGGGGTGGGGTGGGETVANPTATTVPAVSPTPTRAPAPTPTLVPPAAVTVKCDVVYTPSPPTAGVTCTGNVTGTATTTRWSVNGLPAPAPPGSTAFSTTFTQDTTASIEMTACNVTVCRTGAAAVVIKFTTPTPPPSPTPPPGTPTPIPTAAPVGPPATVHIECTWSSTAPGAQIDCNTVFAEAYNTITWTTTNANPASLTTGSKSFQAFRSAPGVATVQATVCFGSSCTASNVAQIPGTSAFNSALTIVDPGTQCTFQSFTLTIYFSSWSSGDPVPNGDLTVNATPTLSGPGPVPIQPNAFAGQPGISTTLFFDGPSTSTITVSFPGDGTWPASNAQINITGQDCP